MNGIPLKNLMIAAVMVACALISFTFKPSVQHSGPGEIINLDTLIPKTFGDWKQDDTVQPLSTSPDQDAELKKIYSQILTRTYINSAGQRIMMSVVYGDGIDRRLDIHRPEICYPAQGFSVSRYTDHVISTLSGELSLRQLVATNGRRVEPISYWIKVGEKSVNNSFERKVQKLIRGLTGQADSGLLARVSSIGNDHALAYKEQESFINSMLQAMPEASRKQLVGQQGS